MNPTRKPLAEVDAEDIRQLCNDEVSEGHELELKQELPARENRRDPWVETQDRVGEYARNEIAKEIIAFANTFGGTVVIGIEETDDEPGRARSIMPLPQVHDLARRLRQAIYDTIDPPLPVFEAVGISTEDDGSSGVVVLRVPPSRRRPHRLNANKEVYVRRIDEAVAIDMRQIHELTIHALGEARQVESEIALARDTGRKELQKWLRRQTGGESLERVVGASMPGILFQLIAVPVVPIELGRVANRPSLYPEFESFNILLNDRTDQAIWPFLTGGWRPNLRAVVSEYDSPEYRLQYRLRTSGACELQFHQRMTDESGFFISWLLCAYAGMLYWIERLRRGAAVPGLEFAIAPMFTIVGKPAVLAPLGSRNFKESQRRLPTGTVEFPLQSVGSSDEFELLLQRFYEDVWNYAGADVQGLNVKFDLSPLHAKQPN